MKLTIGNIEVTLYSNLADSFCVSGDVVDKTSTPVKALHCHFYVSRQDRRTLPNSCGLDHPIIYVDRGVRKPRRTDTVWGKAFVEMTLAYADSLKLWDAAETAIAEKAVQEHKANVERRKIARMRDHAEQMYELLVATLSCIAPYSPLYTSMTDVIFKINKECTCGDIYDPACAIHGNKHETP